MKRKSQIYGQIFIYILTIILVSFILVYGYNSIQNFKERTDQVCIIKLKNDMQNAIEIISSDFGSVKRKDIQLCSRYIQICFVESFSSPQIPNSIDPIIKDSVLSNSGRNVFLVENVAKESFYAGKISVEPDVLCVNAIHGKVSLRLEGKGNHALLSQWS